MLINQIKILEELDDSHRFTLILEWMKKDGLTPEIDKYSTGQNIFLQSPRNHKIAVASHFDTVPFTPGANDDASAVVVCLELARRNQKNPLRNIGLDIYIFDEEEKGLIGSNAYLQKFGTTGLIGLMNMEMVGKGNQFAIWPLNSSAKGKALESFEFIAKKKKIPCGRYDRIVMNTADHESFRSHGLEDSFTITCISDEDVSVAAHYYKAMALEVDNNTLYKIINRAPIFEHYHQPTDKSDFLSETTLQMTADTIWETIVKLDEELFT
jgi:Peptidase family M28